MSKTNETDAKAFDPNDPAYVDDRVASMINTMIQATDPRIVAKALLENAAALTQFIVKAGKQTPQQVALQFSQALVMALEPQEVEESRIQVVRSLTQ